MSHNIYDSRFFEQRKAKARRSAARVVEWLHPRLRPSSVVDVGCGTGEWLAAFAQMGVRDVLGIDGSWIPTDQLEIPLESFHAANLLHLSIPTRSFDLAICLEVAEHLPAEHGEQLVENLTESSPVVLFSAAIPGQGGTGHVNEQWPAFWISRFEERGYRCVDCLRGRFWDDPDVAWWYAQNAFLFVDRLEQESLALLRELEVAAPFSQRPVVHPVMLAEKIAELSDPANYSLRLVIRTLPELLARSVWSRLARK